MKNKTFFYQISDMFKSVKEMPGWLLHGIGVSKQIRLIREALGMTQQQLARAIHARQSAVAQMEKGSDFQISTLRKIADALHCELIVALVPKRDIQGWLDEKSTAKARDLVADSAGNAAMEMQKPSEKFIEHQVQEMKEEILRKHRKSLWEK